jgi:hypothetical protein
VGFGWSQNRRSRGGVEVGTNADKRRAVETLLADEEWAKRSNAWIAEQCKVSDMFVSAIRKEHQTFDPPTARPAQSHGQDGKSYSKPGTATFTLAVVPYPRRLAPSSPQASASPHWLAERRSTGAAPVAAWSEVERSAVILAPLWWFLIREKPSGNGANSSVTTWSVDRVDWVTFDLV